jgi:hypothetical protein
VKFTCNFLRLVQANRATSLGLGRERAQAPVLRVWAWARCASAPHAPPGRISAREPARHAACDPSAAPARRGSPYRALTRRSLRHEANMPRRAHIGYKSPLLWLPRDNTAVRRPPLSPPPWARASASFHRRPTIPISSLDPSKASMAARWPPLPRASPESA